MKGGDVSKKITGSCMRLAHTVDAMDIRIGASANKAKVLDKACHDVAQSAKKGGISWQRRLD